MFEDFTALVWCIRKKRLAYCDDMIWLLWKQHVENSIKAIDYAFSIILMPGDNRKYPRIEYMDDYRVIDFIYKNTNIINEKSIDVYGMRGYYHVIKYLYSKGFECSQSAMLDACCRGETEMVMYLYGQGLEITNSMIDMIFIWCHFSLVVFLYNIGKLNGLDDETIKYYIQSDCSSFIASYYKGSIIRFLYRKGLISYNVNKYYRNIPSEIYKSNVYDYSYSNY